MLKVTKSLGEVRVHLDLVKAESSLSNSAISGVLAKYKQTFTIFSSFEIWKYFLINSYPELVGGQCRIRELNITYSSHKSTPGVRLGLNIEIKA